MKQILYLTFVTWFFLPSFAYAYLDPGTGNALIYVVVSFFGALLFSLKGIFYSLIGKRDALENEQNMAQNKHRIVIFNEGKAYWNTFLPVVEALRKRGVVFSYYTMDIEDPCLTIDDPNMNNRYIGDGTRAFAKIGNLEADVVLSTTPNIGTEGYPIPRSPKIKKLVHVFHAFDDLTCYHRGSLDHYDAVMMVGPFEEPIIRKLETLRGLPEKELYPAGLPYLDVLASKKSVSDSASARNGKTILIAPSWGVKGCLTPYGSHFIALLAEAGFDVIIRPHPQSRKVEAELLERVKKELADYPNVVWDDEVDGTDSMRRADLLISDTSSVRVDFLFIWQKPIITLEMPMEDMSDFEMADLKESWKENALASLGYTVKKEEIENIANIASFVLAEKTPEGITAFREANIYNWGKSGEAIADYLISRSVVA